MNHLDLKKLKLKSGGHSPSSGEMCVMEAVSYFAHEPWSASPKCASKVITEFCMNWNDSMNDKDRQILKPYIPKIVGTAASKSVELKRSYMALDWYCRVSAPAWLRLAGLKKEAEAIEATAPIVDTKTAKAAQAALDVARQAAYATESAARSAARSAAEWAARSAARSAAESAARSAAWSAAWSAARSAAESAAGSAAEWAAWSAAESAAWSAAWSAARSAAESAAEWAAWSAAESAARLAAWSAAETKLRHTVVTLQKSALELLDRMIEAA